MSYMVSFTNRGHINMQNAHFCYALVWNDCIHMSYVRLGHTVFAFTAEDQPYTLLLFFRVYHMPPIQGLFI